MPDVELLIALGCLVLGGMTFLRLVAGARFSAVQEAERRRPRPAPPIPRTPEAPPVVSGVDVD